MEREVYSSSFLSFFLLLFFRSFFLSFSREIYFRNYYIFTTCTCNRVYMYNVYLSVSYIERLLEKRKPPLKFHGWRNDWHIKEISVKNIYIYIYIGTYNIYFTIFWNKLIILIIHTYNRNEDYLKINKWK